MISNVWNIALGFLFCTSKLQAVPQLLNASKIKIGHILRAVLFKSLVGGSLLSGLAWAGDAELASQFSSLQKNSLRTSSLQTSSSSRALLIKNANVVTMTGASPEILRHHSVLIEGDKIIDIVANAKMPTVKDALIINAHEKFLLPGLIDVHVHIWDTPELYANLAYGITTIRNASGMPFHLAFARQIEAGELDGPRLITTGPILNGQGPNTQPNHQIVNNAQEARDAVKQQYAQGYRHIKVYSNLSRESYEALLAEANRLGMTIMGHTPEGVRDSEIPHTKPFNIAFEEILDDNFVSIEHMESIVWHALAEELNEQKLRKVAKQIAQSKTPVTPTLLAHRNLMRVAQSKGKYLKRPEVEFLNPFISAMESETFDFWSSQPANARKPYDEFYLRATKIFQEEGVTLLAGTDSGIFTNIPGRSIIDELLLLARAGLTPYEIIQTATVNPATMLGFKDQIGQIKEGFVADLILVDADPTRDIAVLKDLSGVVVRGKWYDEKAILNLKAKAADTSYVRSEKRVKEGLAAQGTILN